MFSLLKKMPNWALKYLYHFSPHQQRMKVPAAPHLQEHLVSGNLWILAIQIGLQLSLTLICISLITNYDEHLFIFLFANRISPLVRWLLRSFAHILIRLFVLLSFKSFFYILDKLQKKRALSVFRIKYIFQICFSNILSQSVACLFIFLTVSFAE